jgi:nucleoside-diphosphate-sugar epimerase
MKNLIIGNTSQLSYFFPEDYERISSRNIDLDKIGENRYDRIFILFAEQRTFLEDGGDFDSVNFDYTIEVIDRLKECCGKIVAYSTSELWNGYDSAVSLSMPYLYNETPYIRSKEKLCNYINANRKKYSNVIIVYPFNFNSVYRKEGFLFSKIFDSIINDRKIEIGNVDFRRDLIHPKKIADLSISAEGDIIIGSGQLINILDFIKDIYSSQGKDYREYISINTAHNLSNKRNEYYSSAKCSDYGELLDLTIKDIYEYKISKGYNRF